MTFTTDVTLLAASEDGEAYTGSLALGLDGLVWIAQVAVDAVTFSSPVSADDLIVAGWPDAPTLVTSPIGFAGNQALGTGG